MKLVIMAGKGGSGGFMRHINGLLHEGYIPDCVEIKLFCAPGLAGKLVHLDCRVEICAREEINQSALKFIFCKIPPSIRAEIDTYRPDIVFFIDGFIQDGLENYKSVILFHNLLLLDYKELLANGLSRFTVLLLLLSLKQLKSFHRANGIIFLSNHSREFTLRRWCRGKPYAIISHGLDETFRTRDMTYKPFQETIQILYLSTLFHYKHQIEVLTAIYSIRSKTGRDIRIKFVGGGDVRYKNKIIREIKHRRAEKYVTLLGSISHEEIPKMIDQADIFLYASSCETFGLTLLEGMGRGAVIASSNRCGLPEMLKDAGVYFDPENPDSISKALEELLSTDDQIEEKRMKALAYSREYTWEKCAAKTFQFFEELLQ